MFLPAASAPHYHARPEDISSLKDCSENRRFNLAANHVIQIPPSPPKSNHVSSIRPDQENIPTLSPKQKKIFTSSCKEMREDTTEEESRPKVINLLRARTIQPTYDNTNNIPSSIINDQNKVKNEHGLPSIYTENILNCKKVDNVQQLPDVEQQLADHEQLLDPEQQHNNVKQLYNVEKRPDYEQRLPDVKQKLLDVEEQVPYVEHQPQNVKQQLPGVNKQLNIVDNKLTLVEETLLNDLKQLQGHRNQGPTTQVNLSNRKLQDDIVPNIDSTTESSISVGDKQWQVNVKNINLSVEELKNLIDDENNCERFYSNEFLDQCLLKCWLCGEEEPKHQFRSHLKTVHSTWIKAYKSLFGGLTYSRIVFHKCDLCGEDIQMENKFLKNHFRFHGLSFHDYRTRFPGVPGYTEEEQASQLKDEHSVNQNSTIERSEMLPHPNLEDSNKKLENEDTAKDLESVCTSEIALIKPISKLENSLTSPHSDEGNEDEQSKTREDRRENRRIKKTCLEKEELPFHMFNKHLLNKHDLKLPEYRRQHGIPKFAECMSEKKQEKCNDEIAESERNVGNEDEGSTIRKEKKEKKRMKTTCLECKEALPSYKLNKHLQTKHMLKPSEYRRKHGIASISQFSECKLGREKEKCNEEIAEIAEITESERNVENEDEGSKRRENRRMKITCLECKEALPSSKLNKHLQTKHMLKSREYRRKHGIARKSKSSVCKLGREKEKCNEEIAKIAESESNVGNEDEGPKRRENKRLKITCLEYKEALPSSKLNKHLQTKHNLKPREYRRKHGIARKSKSSVCKLEKEYTERNEEIAQLKPNKLKIDLKRLKVTISEDVALVKAPVVVPILKRSSTSPNPDLIENGGKKFSDILADQCIFQCEVCHQHMNRKQLTKHVVKKHQKTWQSYKDVYGDFNPISDVFYRCKCCQAEMLFVYELVLMHCRTVHKMSFPDYRTKYSAFSEDVSRVFSRNWSDACTCLCPFCSKVFPHGQLLHHTKSVHKKRPGPYQYVKKTYYRCIICTSVIQLTKNDIRDHLRTIHGLTLEEYMKYPGAFEGGCLDDTEIGHDRDDIKELDSPGVEESQKDQIESIIQDTDNNYLCDSGVDMKYFDKILSDLGAKNNENDVREQEDSEVDHQKDKKENNTTNEQMNGEPRRNENLNENKEENGLNNKDKNAKDSKVSNEKVERINKSEADIKNADEDDKEDANDDEKPSEVYKKLSTDDQNQENAGTNSFVEVKELLTELDNGNNSIDESESESQLTVIESTDIELIQVRNLQEFGLNVNEVECTVQCYEEEVMDCDPENNFEVVIEHCALDEKVVDHEAAEDHRAVKDHNLSEDYKAVKDHETVEAMEDHQIMEDRKAVEDPKAMEGREVLGNKENFIKFTTSVVQKEPNKRKNDFHTKIQAHIKKIEKEIKNSFLLNLSPKQNLLADVEREQLPAFSQEKFVPDRPKRKRKARYYADFVEIGESDTNEENCIKRKRKTSVVLEISHPSPPISAAAANMTATRYTQHISGLRTAGVTSPGNVEINSLNHLVPDSVKIETQEDKVPSTETKAELSGDVVFLCPFLLDGCKTVTDLNGLQSGTASRHCISVHKTVPYMMAKKNITWKKVEKTSVDFSIFVPL